MTHERSRPEVASPRRTHRWSGLLTRFGASGLAASAGALAVVLAVISAACAPTRLTLPAGPGTPAADVGAAFAEASSACRSAGTIRATIALSGRAGGQRMRGTLIAGLAPPDALRLEGVAPFGPPAFILAAHGGSATLLFPRDNRVVTGVSAADILEALAGVRLDPAALRGILTGCVVVDPRPDGGRVFTHGWMAIDVGHGATAYLLRQQGTWRVVAGLLPGLEVQYQQFEGGRPQTLVIQSRRDESGSGVAVDLTLALSDVAVNATLNASAFDVDLPRDASPMTLAELREAGPLGAKAVK